MCGGDMSVSSSARRRLLRSLCREDGATLVEISVSSFVAALAVGLLVAFLVNSFETGIFTEGQAATIDDARNAMLRVEKELRGADSITWCAPTGSCLVVGAQTAQGGFRTVRYVHSGSVLQRQELDPVTSTWTELRTVVERVQNAPSQPVFACDTQSTLLRVNVNLLIRPTPESEPNYNVHTSIRPRNFPSKASCP